MGEYEEQKQAKQWAAFRRASSWQEWLAMAWLGAMPFMIYFAVWPMHQAVPMFLAVYALGLHFRCISLATRAEKAEDEAGQLRAALVGRGGEGEVVEMLSKRPIRAGQFVTMDDVEGKL